MIGGTNDTKEQYLQKVNRMASYLNKMASAKRRIFDALTREGIDINGIKHKKRISMFLTMFDFQRPIEMRWQDYIISLYDNKLLPAPIPRKREPKKEPYVSPIEKEQSERRKKYIAYLKSDEWKSFRAKALDYFGNRCGLCDTDKGTMDLHHKHYRNFMNETFADVIPLCRKCHARHHNKHNY